jgi:hypothetical protein
VAVRLVAEDGLPDCASSGPLWRDHRVFAPSATIRNGVEASGGKRVETLSSTYLGAVLVNFSGCLAIDEVYDGPFGILSVVDNRGYHRFAYRVLDHKPTRKDVLAFLTEFKGHLDQLEPPEPGKVAAVFGGQTIGGDQQRRREGQPR